MIPGLYDAWYPHRVNVEAFDTADVDASGATRDDEAVTVEFTGVPCVVNAADARDMADFHAAGLSVSHLVETTAAGIKAGRRLVLPDGRYLLVRTVKPVLGVAGMMPDRYLLACDEERIE
jgi:hypothetical protein